MDSILDWPHRLDEISTEGRDYQQVANQQQCDALAQVLDLETCDAISVRYRLQALNGDRIQLTGRLSARGVQACVVSLEPIAFQFDEDIQVMFVPAGSVAVEAEIEYEVLSLEDLEDYSGAALNVGPVFFDHFGAALDPYPRKLGAQLAGPRPADQGDDETPHPFAELGKIKRST